MCVIDRLCSGSQQLLCSCSSSSAARGCSPAVFSDGVAGPRTLFLSSLPLLRQGAEDYTRSAHTPKNPPPHIVTSSCGLSVSVSPDASAPRFYCEILRAAMCVFASLSRCSRGTKQPVGTATRIAGTSAGSSPAEEALCETLETLCNHMQTCNWGP